MSLKEGFRVVIGVTTNSSFSTKTLGGSAGMIANLQEVDFGRCSPICVGLPEKGEADCRGAIFQKTHGEAS